MTDPIAYNYVRTVLVKEFPGAYLRFARKRSLHYELTSMIELCAPLLKGLEIDDHFLKEEVTLTIAGYLRDN